MIAPTPRQARGTHAFGSLPHSRDPVVDARDEV